MSEDLKPCPGCGKEPVIQGESDYAYVRCVCGWRGPNSYVEADDGGDACEAAAAEAWNRRAGQQGEARPARALPLLPIPWKLIPDADGVLVDVFRAFQMRDFGHTAIATQAVFEEQAEQGERDTLRALLREARSVIDRLVIEPVESDNALLGSIDAALADGGAK